MRCACSFWEGVAHSHRDLRGTGGHVGILIFVFLPLLERTTFSVVSLEFGCWGVANSGVEFDIF
jgi:hypothetical protein